MESSRQRFFEVRDLTVTYFPKRGAPIRALNGIKLDIRPGEVVGILGESGCGKSTLANAMLRLLPQHAQSAGKIFCRGRDLLELTDKQLRAIRGLELSLIAQDPALALNPLLTMGLQIEEVLRAHFSLDRKQRRTRVTKLLLEVGFHRPEEIYSAYPDQLSGGQRQRVAIAQAVACRPGLLIADEPTSKLDATLKPEIVALLSQIRLQHGTAILVISHDPTLFAGFADRIAVMYAGRIVEVGTSADIFARPLHPYTEALVRIATSSIITRTKVKGRFPSIAGEFAQSNLLSRRLPV